MVNRKIVGAHYGVLDWLAQRITGVVMIVFTLIVAIALREGVGANYESWHAFMSAGLMRFVTLLFIVSLCWHVWVGVRDIWMDYIQPAGIKLALHVLTLLALIGYTGWATQIIWRL
ncbi:MAG: succinate dehydrogenase, hydrophobic membrane anchor protein [Rhodocyclaceae bacterium]|nr:succinate dehydrogenase, hydrophobic membrane anchor protein [Rhodocyclaceae bacterium]